MTEFVTPAFTLDTAIGIATGAHSGQKDKAGDDYINHPLAVMNHLQGDTARMTGVLHDVVEDTQLTFDDLVVRGCPPEVIEALRLVTHPEGFQNTEEEYLKWIQTIAESGNQIAVDVKWADLTHNSDMGRIQNPAEKDLKRAEKYRKSMEILRPKVSPYLLNK